MARIPSTPGSQLHFRPLGTDDAGMLLALARDAWHASYAHIYDSSFIDHIVERLYAPAALHALVPLLETGRHHFNLALQGEDILAFCHAGILPDGAELYRLYVHPLATGQGIGTRLLQELEAFLARHKLSHYHCFVHRANTRALRFYLSSGFTPHPERDTDTDCCMEKPLMVAPRTI